MSKFAGGKTVLAQYKTAPLVQVDSVDPAPLTPHAANDEGPSAVYSPAAPARSAVDGDVTPPAFVEPSKKPVDSGGSQRNGESADHVEDWAAVSSMHEQRAKQEMSSKPSNAMPIRFQEALEALRADEKSWKLHLGNVKRVSAHVKTSGFAGFWWSCLHSEIKESSADFADRDFVLALNFVPLDHGNEIHRRLLLTIYRRLVKTKREDPDPPTVGPMWSELGFQGNDPATDLRSTGIFGLLQILYLIEYYPVFGGLLFRTAINPLREVPFALVSFNFSGVVMDVLKERGLHDCIHSRRKDFDHSHHARQQQQQDSPAAAQSQATLDPVSGAISGGCAFGSELWTPPPVVHSTCDLLVGSLFEFYKEWTKLDVRPITDFGPMKGKLREYIRGNVASVLSHCSAARDRRAVLALESRAREKNTTSKSGDENLEFHEF